MTPDSIKQLLERRGIDPSEHLELHNKFSARKVDFLRTEKGDRRGDFCRIRSFSLALRQIYLHRALFQMEGTFEALSNENGYSMVLAIRGAFEATAALGYLHNRLNSLKNGTLNPEQVDNDIYTLLLGFRDRSIKKAVELGLPEAKQVMSMLDYADKSFSKSILGASTETHKFLREEYEFLSEFCHPNSLSNSLAIILDNGEIHFRYSRNINQKELDLINPLILSCKIFVELFDDIDTVLSEIKL